MPVPVENDVRRALSPYHPMIRSVIEDAWSEWRAIWRFRQENGFGPVLYNRTISNVMFDAIARRAIPRFGKEKDALLMIDAQTFKAYVKGILIRFKKGDEDNLGRNWPTQMALAFEQAELKFPGVPSETAKIEIIWRPNDIWTKIEQILVVARNGAEQLWEYEIPAAGEPGVVEPMPIAPLAPEGSDKLVKPKKARAKKALKS